MSMAEHDADALLQRVRELVSTARPMPLSSSVLVSREDILELLDDAITRLPEELRQARWLLREREEFLDKAKREADEIVETARTRAERMVQRTEVVREAQRTARAIVDESNDDASRMRNETQDYIDQKLAAFEVVLERTAQQVQRGRAQLQAQVEEPTLLKGEGEDDLMGDANFFDQDNG